MENKKVNVRYPKHVAITVKRPNGKTEVVEVQPQGFKAIDDKIFETMKKATREAGRGEMLSYENVSEYREEEIVFTEADKVGMKSDKLETYMAFGENK